MDIPVDCAPNVAPDTLIEIARVESQGDPLAIHVNDAGNVEYTQPRTLDEAAAIAARLIAEGHNVDMGAMQINSANLDWLGMTPAEVFDPCMNVAAGGRLLTEAYQRAAAEYGPGQRALQAALSVYNTGDFTSGFENGYLARYGLVPSVGELDAEAALANTSVDLSAFRPSWFVQVDTGQPPQAAQSASRVQATNDPYTASTSVQIEYLSELPEATEREGS